MIISFSKESTLINLHFFHSCILHSMLWNIALQTSILDLSPYSLLHIITKWCSVFHVDYLLFAFYTYNNKCVSLPPAFKWYHNIIKFEIDGGKKKKVYCGKILVCPMMKLFRWQNYSGSFYRYAQSCENMSR